MLDKEQIIKELRDMMCKVKKFEDNLTNEESIKGFKDVYWSLEKALIKVEVWEEPEESRVKE